MASQDQIYLSDFIKSVHQNLRDDTNKNGADNAWEKHCQDFEQLDKYAIAMSSLALNHWDKRYEHDSHQLSRVEWVIKFSEEYFFMGDLVRRREKEKLHCEKFDLDVTVSSEMDLTDFESLKLLDVGSCYNPFKKFPKFDVLAIDISPATNDVIRGDFLKLNVVTDLTNSCHQSIVELQESSFHIVVFSLLLEYFPSPEQRLLCCEKAYKLLKPEGILIIITPDSKHVGANAKYMKSWRMILAKMGFARVRYEKLPHIHCMAFRKCIHEFVTIRWADLHINSDLFDKFYIPQDFKTDKSQIAKVQYKDGPYIDIENELPHYESD